MSEPHSPTEGRAASARAGAAQPAPGAYAAPLVSRLVDLERQLVSERDRRIRAERLATSLAQRVAAGGGESEAAPAGAFARWRALRADAAELEHHV